MVAALEDLRRLVTAPTLVVHPRYWSLAFGRTPELYRESLRGGITMASTRYLYGDDFTRADYDRVDALPPGEAGVAFATAVEARLPGRVACRPAFVLRTDTPTTVGLGDTFVGGFLAAWWQG